MDKNLNFDRLPIVQPYTSKNEQKKRRSKQTRKRIKRHKPTINSTWIFPSCCNSFIISNKPEFDCYYTIYRGWSFDYTAFFYIHSMHYVGCGGWHGKIYCCIYG